jgi:hypothetical protein
MARAAVPGICRRSRLLRLVALAMSVITALVSMPTGHAQAALIGTDQVIGEAAAVSERERVASFLEREDVRAQLAKLGIDADEAAARVASLSDEEVSRISGHLGELPSGEGAVGAVIGAAVLIFLVLLVTDLLGLTDVFPFVRN